MWEKMIYFPLYQQEWLRQTVNKYTLSLSKKVHLVQLYQIFESKKRNLKFSMKVVIC